MRKSTLLFLAFAAVSFSVCQAQKGSYAKGDKLLNIGIGVNSYYSGGIPLGASLEVGITDDISIGANVDYLSNTYNYGLGSKSKFTAIYFGGRASYHVNKALKIESEKIDLYGGATIGFRSFSFKDTYSGFETLSGSYGSGVYLGAFIGGKYYFNKKIGAFAELGAIGSTNARVGIAFRF